MKWSMKSKPSLSLVPSRDWCFLATTTIQHVIIVESSGSIDRAINRLDSPRCVLSGYWKKIVTQFRFSRCSFLQACLCCGCGYCNVTRSLLKLVSSIATSFKRYFGEVKRSMVR